VAGLFRFFFKVIRHVKDGLWKECVIGDLGCRMDKIAIVAILQEWAMIKMTSVEAQNKFGQLLDTVQRETVAITRHGRPTAFVVSPQEMEELLDARRRRSRAVADLEMWSEQAKKNASPAAAALTDEDVTRLVHESR
jgi:antitoxin Phd